MKIFIKIFIFIIFFNFYLFAFQIPMETIGSVGNSCSSSDYNIEYASFGNTFVDTSENNSYNFYDGYLYYFDSFYNPAYFKIISDQKFICKRNSLTDDTAIFNIYDFDGSPVKGIGLNFSVINKPDSAVGDNLIFTSSNDSGAVYLKFLAGNKNGSYIVKASYPDAGVKYVGFHTDNIDLPEKEWRMIGVNKQPLNPNVDNCFINVKPDFIYHWYPDISDNPFNQRYKSVKTINAGEGYFVILPKASEFSVLGNFIKDTYTVQLKTGWNQLSSPYFYITDWLSAQIIVDSQILTVEQAEEKGFIYKNIFWYKDNNYYWGPNEAIPSPKLYVWTGFWVQAKRDSVLQFNPNFSYTENSKINLAPKKTNSENWEVLISVIGDKSNDMINYFGITDATTGNFDTVNVHKAPGISGMMSVGFSSASDLAKDIRKSPITKIEEWKFNIYSGNNTNLKANFSGIENIPPKYVIYIVDRNEKTYFDLKEQNSISFVMPKNSVKEYKIYVGLPQYVLPMLSPPLSKENTFVKPNPVTAGQATFVYSLPVGAGVFSLKVFDLAGVKVIEKQIDINSYPTSYIWDCRNQAGKPIHTGLYLYILEYNGNGESYKLVDKMAVVR